jgi:hypothetical protein
MKLVDEARHAWKWLSVQFAAFGAAATVVWLGLPDDSRQQIIAALGSLLGIRDPVAAAVLVAFLSIIVGRLKKQGT